MSFFTCFCDLPQNEHFSSSPPSPNFATLGYPRSVRSACASAHRGDRAAGVGELSSRDDLVDDAVLLGFLRRHYKVAVGVAVDLLDRLPGVARQELLEEHPHPQDLPGRQLDVGGLALRPGVGLVDEDTGVREGEALARRAG